MVTYAITGASKGLGLEMCKQLAARGETVYALVRSGNSKLAELGSSVKVVEGIDVTKVPWQNARVQFSASSAMSTHLSQKSPRPPPPPPPPTHTHTPADGYALVRRLTMVFYRKTARPYQDDVGDKLKAGLEGVSIDVLLCNAGAYGGSTADGPMAMFASQQLDTVSMDGSPPSPKHAHIHHPRSRMASVLYYHSLH